MAGLIHIGDAKTRQQIGHVVHWAVRKGKYGPSGRSVEGRSVMRTVTDRLIAARRAIPLSKVCGRGHRFTPANTLWSWDKRRNQPKRYCRACLAVAKGAARRLVLQRRWVAHLKAAMIAAHPDRGGTARQFLRARARYLRAVAA